jgi:hypothetical protein
VSQSLKLLVKSNKDQDERNSVRDATAAVDAAITVVTATVLTTTKLGQDTPVSVQSDWQRAYPDSATRKGKPGSECEQPIVETGSYEH